MYKDTAREVGEDGITLKELVPIVVACAVWGPQWWESSALVHCNNEGAITVINSGYSKVEKMMHLLHCLFFIWAKFSIEVKAIHVPGKDNEPADAISHNNMIIFLSQIPEAMATKSDSRGAGEVINDGMTRLNIGSLVPTVRELFSAGIAKSTHRTYKSGSM